MVFVHISVVPLVTDISSAAVTTGLANTLGNKGGVGVQLSIGSTSFLFVNSHLAAHQNAVKARNSNFERIDAEMPAMLKSAARTSPAQSTEETKSPTNNQADSKMTQERDQSDAPRGDKLDPSSEPVNTSSNLIGHSLSHGADVVVFMGDLNYRIRGNR